MLDLSLTTLGVFYVERECFIHCSISCWVWQESRHFFCSRYTWWLVIQWVAWEVKWPKSEMGGIWRPTYWGGIQGGGGARGAMVANNKWPEKRITPPCQRAFTSQEAYAVRTIRFQVAKRLPYGYPEKGWLSFLPAQHPFPSPLGMPSCPHYQSIGLELTSPLDFVGMPRQSECCSLPAMGFVQGWIHDPRWTSENPLKDFF